MSGLRSPGRGARRAPRLAATIAAAAALIAGCVAGQGGWDEAALLARHPQLAARERGRLADVVPFFRVGLGELTLFLCRWDLADPIRVSLPPDGTSDELEAVKAALTAWERAIPGLRFAPEPAGAESLEIRFVSAADAPGATGDTIASCRLERGGPSTSEVSALGRSRRPSRVPSRLARASVWLRRTNTDMVGRETPVSRERLIGAVAHELGHALGFSGHAAIGGGIMVAETGRIERWGARILAEGSLEEPALAALYALPSGVVVGHVEIPDAPGRLADSLAKAARRAGWDGPFVRVSETSARLSWRKPGLPSAVLGAFDYPGSLRRPERFQLFPSASARALLE